MVLMQEQEVPLRTPYNPAEKGTLRYARYTGRDTSKPMNPHAKGETFLRFMKYYSRRNYELWPVIGLMGLWAVGVSVFAVYQFNKFEIWLDRSKKLPPWDWERCRNNYLKNSMKLFYPGNSYKETHTPNRLVEVLNDELIEAAKLRGTR